MKACTLIASLLAIAASAAPVLEERGAPETFFLTNTVFDDEAGNHNLISSHVLYYAAGTPSTGGSPTDSCTLKKDGVVTWEGKQLSCKFASSGVTFYSNIQANGQQVKMFTKAGTGHNKYHQYNCNRDNFRILLWSEPSSKAKREAEAEAEANELVRRRGTTTTQSVYYCLIAN